MSPDTVVVFITNAVYPALLVLFFFGLTIFIHELGHFLVAKRCGMKIERFSVGFGPKIWGYTKDGINYRVSWFPFGGYVALPQMSPMETIEGETESKPEDLPPVPPGSKFKVAIAGPLHEHRSGRGAGGGFVVRRDADQPGRRRLGRFGQPGGTGWCAPRRPHRGSERSEGEDVERFHGSRGLQPRADGARGGRPKRRAKGLSSGDEVE